jgi:hypothetical protein
VQADAGKTGGTIESLLIEHARLNKTPRTLARMLSTPATKPATQPPRTLYFNEKPNWDD